MLDSLRDLPIKRKLTAITLVTSTVSLLLACALFVAYEQVNYRRQMVRDLDTTAHMIGFNSASALAFDDPNSAEETLKGVSAEPHIIAACIYRPDGRVFATYQHPGAATPVWPTPQPDNEAFDADALNLFRSIESGGETIGTIYLRSDLTEFAARWVRYGFITLAVLVATMLVAWLLASRLQRVVSEPVSQLAAIAARVAAGNDYSARAVKRSNDELGQLIDGFNHMLSQVQARDAELQLGREQLEERVEQRTAALQEAQEAADREKARFKLIFEAVPVGISYYSGRREGEAVTSLINEAHLRICGLTREQAADPRCFKQISHPEDSARQQVLDAQLGRGEISGYTIEKRYLRPDGKTVWVVFTTQRRTSPGGVYERLSTIVDVTDLKRAQDETAHREAQLRFIIEAVPFSVTWIYYRGEEVERMMNRAFFRITGLESGRIPDVNDVRAISHPEDLKKQDDFRGRLNRGEIDGMSMEKRYLRPNGDVVWVVLTITVFRGPDGKILQEVSTLVDITERKQAEIELEQLHKQLLETSRQAGMAEVATGVLHNVGNVLNSVNVSSTLVSDQVRRSKIPNVSKVSALLTAHGADLGNYLTNDPKGKMVPLYLATLAENLIAEHKSIVVELENLRKNIEHIKEIVAMQQSYAKTSGVTETVSVPDLVEDAIRMNAGSLARHDVQIGREYEARPVVTLEKNKVLQIIVNLVRNAKYACDETGRSDKLISTRITADHESVSIAIVDNGVGIPPENLTRIFAHGFTTRKQGHGFGLHSGALAAKELGGSLTAYSEGPGRGATFILKLPYKPNPTTP
ncbi:MAG: sensor signal transduction histidine kinase [Verrucomicrobia bacterium]|nr:sensor signal transduction histidine kinase [Verrucomicrobiota bacterium]